MFMNSRVITIPMDTMCIPWGQLVLEAMKLSEIGHPRSARNKPGQQAAITLLELVVVMTIMLVVIGVEAPSFKGFLQSRNLANEAQRFLSFTHYGMGRAIGEGVPVDMVINVKQGWYSLAAAGGYTETRTNETYYYLDNERVVSKQDMQMMVYPSLGTMTQSNSWTQSAGHRNRLPVIRFQPDGFISDSSPARILFRQLPASEIWIVENPNRKRYEVQVSQFRTARF
jgi:Tfp pilus assembly protein FimT